MEEIKETVYLKKVGNGVAYVVLNKPERKNAINVEMMRLFTACINAAEADSEIKAIIVKGEGHCFCAGGDLKGAANYDNTVECVRQNIYDMCQSANAIIKCSKPVIAMVEGYAIGGGTSLALACDVIFMADNAKMALNFLRLGLSPELGSLLTLAKSCGLHRAKEVMLTGRRLSAEEALDLGLVSRICPSDEIEAATLEFAASVAEMPAVPVEITKRYLNNTFLSGIDQLMASEAQNSTCCSLSDECMEYRMKNFMKK